MLSNKHQSGARRDSARLDLADITHEILEESSEESKASEGQSEVSHNESAKSDTKCEVRNALELGNIEFAGKKNDLVQRKSSEDKKPPRLSTSGGAKLAKGKSRSARNLLQAVDSALLSELSSPKN